MPLCFFLSKLDEAMLGLEVKQKLVHLGHERWVYVLDFER